MGCTCFEGCVCICDGTACVVVEVAFDIAGYDGAESADEFVDLSWVCAADSVCYAYSVDSELSVIF